MLNRVKNIVHSIRNLFALSARKVFVLSQQYPSHRNNARLSARL